MEAVAPTVLEGRDVVLVPADPGYAPDLYQGSHGTEAASRVWTYMPYGPFSGTEEMERWIGGLTASTDPLFFTVLNPEGVPLGMASYLNIDLGMRRLEIGHIWYTMAAQLTTANTEVAYLMAHHAFEELGARRLEWKCDSLNERSRSAALRLGFRFEGVFRNHMIVKGRNRDTAYYAMTDADWDHVRPVLEDWLYDADRDPAGRPVHSLTDAMRAISRED